MKSSILSRGVYRSLRALFNIRVVDAASFDELILSKLSLQHQLDKERTEAAQEIGRLQATIRINDARVQWLIASFQEQARHQQGLVSHALKTVAQSRASKGSDLQQKEKLIAIVVLT